MTLLLVLNRNVYKKLFRLCFFEDNFIYRVCLMIDMKQEVNTALKVRHAFFCINNISQHILLFVKGLIFLTQLPTRLYQY